MTATTDTHLPALSPHAHEEDLASQDVLIEVVRALEQQLWMVRVQLQS